MSAYRSGEVSEDYDAKIQASRELFRRFEARAEFEPLARLVRWLLASVDSAPIGLLTAIMEPGYYPLALRLQYEQFAHYLTIGEQSRSRERLSALYSVYGVVRRRVDCLDTEFWPYIERLSESMHRGPSMQSVFPAEQVRERFCAPCLHWDEVEDVFWGLPDTIRAAGTDRRVRLSCLEGSELTALKKELASEAKSRALHRFYVAFLASFEERVMLALTNEGFAVRDCVDDDMAFSDAIHEGLRAVEQPETVASLLSAPAS